MKAYHNLAVSAVINAVTVFQWTKIQNWKLITTAVTAGNKKNWLYFNELRYKIESLSQPCC